MLVAVADVHDEGLRARADLPMPNGISIVSPSFLSSIDVKTASQYACESATALMICARVVAVFSNASSACGDFSPLAAEQKT